MKKKLLALASALFMVFSLVGCGSEGLSLVKEIQEVQTWEAVDQTGSMSFDMTMGEESVKLAMDYTAYTVKDKLQMEMTVTPKTLDVSGEVLDLAKGETKLSPIKLYMDGVKLYMSSSCLKEIIALAGATPADVADVLDLSKEFIAFDMTDTYKEMGIDINGLIEDSKKATADLYAELGKLDTDIAIKQDGRKYTMELTSDQMVEACISLFAQSLEMQKDLLVAEYKEMGLTDAQIELTMAQLSAMTSKEALAPVKDMVKGSAAKVTLAYEDGKQTTEYAFNLNVNVDEDNTVIFKVDMKDEAKKAEVKEVKMPTDVKVYALEDLMAVTAEEAKAIEVEEKVAEEKAVVEKAAPEVVDTKEVKAEKAA